MIELGYRLVVLQGRCRVDATMLWKKIGRSSDGPCRDVGTHE